MVKRGGRHGTDEAEEALAVSVSPSARKVVMTASAKANYDSIIQRSATNSKNQAGERAIDSGVAIKDAISRIIANPTDKQCALGGPLSDFFQLDQRGIRICWMNSDDALVIVSISDTPQIKADIKDQAHWLARLRQAGYFDVIDEYRKLTDTGPNPPIH